MDPISSTQYMIIHMKTRWLVVPLQWLDLERWDSNIDTKLQMEFHQHRHQHQHMLRHTQATVTASAYYLYIVKILHNDTPCTSMVL